MNPNYIIELCNRVCYRMLLDEDPLLEKEFGSDFFVLEYVVTYFNSFEKTGMTTEDAIKIYEILWTYVSSNVLVHVVQVTVKIHNLLQPKLLAATDAELQSYWFHGGPFDLRIIYYKLDVEGDWSRAFVDAFFIEGGPQIFGQQLTVPSTLNEKDTILLDFYLYYCIIKLAFKWNCSSKFIRDSDFMESLLLFSKRLFSSRLDLDEDLKESQVCNLNSVLLFKQDWCIIIWFCLFRHNETADDCRGRSWSINDVTDEISLFHASAGFFKDLFTIVNLHEYSDVFVTFVEATRDEPESPAIKLAKKCLQKKSCVLM